MAMPGVGRTASAAGLVTGLRKRGNRTTPRKCSGDGRDRLEVSLFQETFERCRHLLVTQNIVCVIKVSRLRDAISIMAGPAPVQNVVDIDRVIEQQEFRQRASSAGSSTARVQPRQAPDRRCELFLPGRRQRQPCRPAGPRAGPRALRQDWTARRAGELRERLSALVGQDGFRFGVDESPAG